MSNADELLKLKELLDSGILTEEEFKSEKDKILDVKPNVKKLINYKTENLATVPFGKSSSFEDMLTTYIYLEDMRLEIKDNKVYQHCEYDEGIFRSSAKYKRPYKLFGGDLSNPKWTKSIPLDEILNIPNPGSYLKERQEEIAGKKPPTKRNSNLDMYQPYVIKGAPKDKTDIFNPEKITLWIYFLDNHFIDEILKFEKNLYTAINQITPNCPKCSFVGLRPAPRLRDCVTCRWRYENLNNL